MQAEINFDKPLFHLENNAESQKSFEEKESRFRGQCKTIMDAFKRGERLTTAKALINYGIGDLRRRIKDLKDIYKVDVQENKMKGGFKEWYLL